MSHPAASVHRARSRPAKKLESDPDFFNAIEKYGSGFIRIRRALQEYPEVQFSVVEKFGGVMVTFALAHPYRQPESLAERVLLALAAGPLSKKALSLALGQQNISGQLNTVIRDLLAQQRITLTLPDKPNSRLQQYRKTSGQKP